MLSLMFGAACVRRSVGKDLGLSGIANPSVTKYPAKTPDASLRSVFRQQTKGTFDPLSDDPHVEELQARLKVNPQDVPPMLELAAIYESYHLYGSALDQYLEATRHLSSEDGLSETATLGFSRSARASHRSDEAINALEALVRQRPSPNAWNELGLLYEDIRAPLSAENAFEHAVAAHPESDSLHNNLGYSLLLQKRNEEAEAEFRKALELNPASARARNNLATVLARRGDLQQALEEFQKASDAAAAHNNLAVVLMEMEQYEQSRQQLVQALAIRHYFAPALANFKVVQERIREQAEVRKFGRVPLSAIRVASSLVALDQDPIAPDKSAKDLEEKQ